MPKITLYTATDTFKLQSMVGIDDICLSEKESCRLLYHLVKSNTDFIFLTNKEYAINFLGELIGDKIINHSDVTIYYEFNDKWNLTTFTPEGYLTNWIINYYMRDTLDYYNYDNYLQN